MSCYNFSNNKSLNSALTVGQLFDKAVDKVMSDKKLRHIVESNKSSHPWPSVSMRRSTIIRTPPKYSWGTK